MTYEDGKRTLFNKSKLFPTPFGLDLIFQKG